MSGEYDVVLTKEEQEEAWNDPANWTKWHAFYNCKEDPRVCVPKKIRWTGWTFNVAHRAFIPFLFLTILVGGGPAAFLCLNGVKDPVLFLAVIGCAIPVLVLMGWYFSKPK